MNDIEILQLAENFNRDKNIFTACALFSIEPAHLTKDSLKKEYTKFILAYHPDKYKSRELKIEGAQTIFIAAQEANKVIKKSRLLIPPIKTDSNEREGSRFSHSPHYHPYSHDSKSRRYPEGILYQTEMYEPVWDYSGVDPAFQVNSHTNRGTYLFTIYKTIELAGEARAKPNSCLPPPPSSYCPPSPAPILFSFFQDFDSSRTTNESKPPHTLSAREARNEQADSPPSTAVDYDILCTTIYNMILEKAESIVDEHKKYEVMSKADAILCADINEKAKKELEQLLINIPSDPQSPSP